MAINAEQHVTNNGGGTNSEQQQQPQTRKRFLQIRPNVPLPFLSSLFPCLRHRADTATPATPPPAAPTPSDPPAPAETPVAPAPIQPTPNSNDVLMSVEDFARFVDAAEDLFKPVPQLWHGFLRLLESFLPPSPAAAEG
ncbi:MAG: hypothetical protein IT168_10595 [Bryobacterales bacterium]|nr:hypothetical protein [Bryobacterales bacterium]